MPLTRTMTYLYLLRCADGTLYCGITDDLKRRLAEHNTSPARAAKYTRGRTPVRLVYREKHPDRGSALRREYEIKQWKKAEKEALIKKKGGARRPRMVRITRD
jgi:putative endonuclease